MLYFIEIKDNAIHGKLECDENEEDREIPKNLPNTFKQVSKEFYSNIKIPSTFELNEKGDYINITYKFEKKENKNIEEDVNILKNKISELEKKLKEKISMNNVKI